MSETARNFKNMREMESADEIRNDLKKNILEKARDYLNGSIVGKTYDAVADTAQESGLMGALNDIYRRVFENGWFGKDVFDGRYQADTQHMGTGYDQRAAFYGLDKPEQQAQEREQDRGDDLER